MNTSEQARADAMADAETLWRVASTTDAYLDMIAPAAIAEYGMRGPEACARAAHVAFRVIPELRVRAQLEVV